MRVDAENARRAGRGRRTSSSTARTRSRPATRSTPPAARRGVPLVEAGVLGMSGLVMSIKPGRTACYRCAFPAPPADAPRCADAGVLGPAAGVIGSLQALEAMKLLTGVAPAIADGFLQVDLATAEFLRVRASRRADCPDCGGGLGCQWMFGSAPCAASRARCGATSPPRTTAIPPRAAFVAGDPRRLAGRAGAARAPGRARAATSTACRSPRGCSRSPRARSRTSRSTRARRSATGCSSTTAPAS